MLLDWLLPLGLAWAGLIAQAFGDEVSLELVVFLPLFGMVFDDLHLFHKRRRCGPRDGGKGGERTEQLGIMQKSQRLCAVCSPSLVEERKAKGGRVLFSSPKS